MTNTEFDAIVVGSGPGGTGCATLLQKRGVRTLFVEKNDVLGGKMISIEKDGYAYDLFPHGQVPMTQPAFYQIYQELGVAHEWAPALSADDPRDIIRIAYRARDWKEYREVTQGQAMEDSTPFFKLWDIPESEQERIMEFMTGMLMMEEDELRELDDVTMHDYLMRHDVPDAIYSYLAFHANASLAEAIDRVAASEQILIMQQMMLEGGGGQYKGGFGQLTKVMIREFEKNGGTLRPPEPGRAHSDRKRRRGWRGHRQGHLSGAGGGQLRRATADSAQTDRAPAPRAVLQGLRCSARARLGLHQHSLLPDGTGDGCRDVRDLFR